MPSTPGLIVAAPATGSGKTTVTLGLLRHLYRSGARPAPFKVGPDYIDPAFHRVAADRESVNLDSWAMRTATFSGLVAGLCDAAGIVVGEGVMGLFDGAPDGTGSTADVAALTGWPVLLVVDAARQAASAAAVVHGFATFRDDVCVRGVIFNRVASDGHRKALDLAMAPSSIPVLGYLPGDEAIGLPDRHLGLVQASEHATLDATLDGIADFVAAHIDLPALASMAGPAHRSVAANAVAMPPLGQRIAVAQDDAFRFAYPHMLEGWRRAGAEIAAFSPLHDEPVDGECDAVFLPGGYPELHAGRLAGNRRFLDSLARAAARGAVIYGECGGHMVLGQGLRDGDGERHAMAGLLPHSTSFEKRSLSLGYRTVRLIADTPIGRAGAAFRGHEFHYSTAESTDGGAPLFNAADGLGASIGDVGSRIGTVMGSFIHLIDAA